MKEERGETAFERDSKKYLKCHKFVRIQNCVNGKKIKFGHSQSLLIKLREHKIANDWIRSKDVWC